MAKVSSGVVSELQVPMARRRPGGRSKDRSAHAGLLRTGAWAEGT